MCTGFGMIVTKELKAYFCEPDFVGDVSHSTILDRLKMKENEDKFIRNFVRIECHDWKIGSFRFDESDIVPGWAENGRDEIIGTVDKVLSRAYPARAEYEKVCDTARAEYKKVCDTARAEYKKVCDPAWSEYKKVCDTAWAEYKKVCDPARAEYKKVRDTAWAEYKKVCDPAQAEYEKVCASALEKLTKQLSVLPGYVGEKEIL